ncbi:MAG: hypothetical protein Q4F84_11120 [Fibrobacter sp.]|nr:hypothetical protein [Fibrobacter sp.]
MKKIFVPLLFIAGIFVGCGEEYVCIESSHFVLLSTISTSDVDSVRFYLNDQRVCYEEANQKWVMCKAAVDNYSGLMILKELFDTNYENCSISQENPKWTGFACTVQDSVDIDSTRLSIWIYSKGTINKINPTFNIFGGQQINVIPEQDTLKWFSFSENPALMGHEAYESPAETERLGCFDGFCFTLMPAVVKSYCD